MSAPLKKSLDFSRVLRSANSYRTTHFEVYWCFHQQPCSQQQMRLGCVIGRRHAAKAVRRNCIRRICRQAFRLLQHELCGLDVVVRLRRRFDAQLYVSASSPALKRLCEKEIGGLLKQLCRRTAGRLAAKV